MSEFDCPNEAKQIPIKINTICLVCGDNASILNYGALSCLSCRTFFRRNAFSNKDVPVCRFDGTCQVTMLTRKVCTACRLAKCLSIGMSPDLIRKEDIAATKRKSSTPKTEEPSEMTTTQSLTSDLVADDNSSNLNAFDQSLISNIVHAFDVFSPVAEVRHRIEMITASSSNTQYDVSESLHIKSLFYKSLQSFLSSIPDYKVLTATEQCSLYQRNMLGFLCIGEMYLIRQSGIFDKPENEMIFLPLYGNEVLQQAKTICQQFNCDPILFKLMLIALAFSSNSYLLHNRGNIDKDSLLFGTFRLLGSQNVYVELMWKYLIHTYDYNNAVKQFSALIKQFLDTLKFSIDLYENNHLHRAFSDDTIEQTEKSTTIRENALVPLWGKK